MLNILEVDDPRLGIVFHLSPRLVPTPVPAGSAGHHPLSPSAEAAATAAANKAMPSPLEVQRTMAQAALDHAKESGVNEGFLLKNLEKDCE